MSSDLIIDKEYKAWLSDIKLKVRNVQIKAALKVQTELLNFYWDLGADIVTKQTHARWGDGLIEQLSKDLMAEFPEIKGFPEAILCILRNGICFIVQQPFQTKLRNKLFRNYRQSKKSNNLLDKFKRLKKANKLLAKQENGRYPISPEFPGGTTLPLLPNARISMKHFIMCNAPLPTTGAATFWCTR